MILGSLLLLSNHRGQVGPAFQAKPDPKFILFWAVRESTPRPVKQAMYTSTLHCCFINPRPGVLSRSTQKYQSVQINKQYLKHVNSLWVLFSTGSNSHQSKHIPPHPPILPPEHSFGKNVQTFVSGAKAEYLKWIKSQTVFWHTEQQHSIISVGKPAKDHQGWCWKRTLHSLRFKQVGPRGELNQVILKLRSSSVFISLGHFKLSHFNQHPALTKNYQSLLKMSNSQWEIRMLKPRKDWKEPVFSRSCDKQSFYFNIWPPCSG